MCILVKTLNMLNDELHKKLNKFKGIICDKKVVVALSGGTDSLVLSKLVSMYAKETTLAMIVGPNIPDDEIDRAKQFAEYLGLHLRTISYNPLSLESFSSNGRLRCYVCKKLMFEKLTELKNELNYDIIVDGTNKSDLNEIRPGLKALHEFNIVSPFAMSEITKNDVLELGKYLGLESWLVPSNTCYATRIIPPLEITEELLNVVRRAEHSIRKISNIKLVRARIHSNMLCRIEVLPEDIELLSREDIRPQIVDALHNLGLKYITLDLFGYKK